MKRAMSRRGCLGRLGAFALGAPALASLSQSGRSEPVPAAEGILAKQKPLLQKLNIREAWEITKGDPQCLIGIIDNGFDFYHPDLKGQLIPGYYFNGGYHEQIYENMAHGTLVASLIVARGDRPEAMTGLAPRCRAITASQGMIEHTLLKRQKQFAREHPNATDANRMIDFFLHTSANLKFAREWADYQTRGAIEAIHYLIDRGARVINFSGGLRRQFCPDQKLWEQLESAYAHAAEKAVVIVQSAGNTAEKWQDYPGSPETMIVAGASMLDDTRWEERGAGGGLLKPKQGSCYGERLTAMAPVENLLICVPHARRFYRADDGPGGDTDIEFKGIHDTLKVGATSCAAPIVSALVALIQCAKPELDAKSVVALVKQGCQDIGEPGRDLFTGSGRIDFGRTLKLATGRIG